jgi:DNA polymerase III epsilon subunit family exonuclease
MVSSNELSNYLTKQTFISFDTETTGMWAPVNRIVEIAAVKFNITDGVIDKFESLINPEREIPAEVIEIHGITDEMVKDAPTIIPVLNQFISFCGNDSILIAHNAPFDISFVGGALKRNELSFGNNLILDTVDIFKRYFPGQKSFSLLNLVKHFKIAQSQEHRALSDANFVFELFRVAVEKFPPVNCIDDFKKNFTTYSMSDIIDEVVSLPDHYVDLNNALANKHRIEISYKHPTRGLHNRVIQPMAFHRLGGVYYIIAFCENVNAERTFRLDRIDNYKIVVD